MELQPGLVFAGCFRLRRLLGVGGFAEVHEAEELSSGALVALKVLHEEMVAHSTAREHFEQEARVASSIRSPHVVSTVDAGVDGPTRRPWVAFEMLTGETLDARLKREPVLPPALVARLFAQLGDALGAAHQVGVVHADVKPENLFFTGSADAPRSRCSTSASRGCSRPAEPRRRSPRRWAPPSGPLPSSFSAARRCAPPPTCGPSDSSRFAPSPAPTTSATRAPAPS